MIFEGGEVKKLTPLWSLVYLAIGELQRLAYSRFWESSVLLSSLIKIITLTRSLYCLSPGFLPALFEKSGGVGVDQMHHAVHRR